MKNMHVDHRRFDITMPQQFLDGSNIKAAFDQVGGKGMTKCAAGDSLCKPRLRHGVSDGMINALPLPISMRNRNRGDGFLR